MSFFCHGLVLKLIFQYLENELFTMHSLSDSHPAYAGLYNVTLLFFATVILTFLKNHIRIIRVKKKRNSHTTGGERTGCRGPAARASR